MRNYKGLKIWEKGFQIAKNGCLIAASLPKGENYGLSSQISRAGISIPSNIAEGSSRSSNKDYARYVEISLGSCFEMETQLLIVQANNVGDQVLIDQTLEFLTEEEKMITSFLSVLQKPPKSKP